MAENDDIWTPRDRLLWQTAQVRVALERGALSSSLPSRFALSLGRDERLLSVARFERQALTAIGDGTYLRGGTIVGGSGVFGAMLGVVTLGGSAAMNARRRAQAAADASVRWRPFDSGVLHVSSCGFYLETAQHLMPFANRNMSRMDLVGPRRVQYTCHMASGRIDSFILTSDASEMVFVTWAVQRCPSHPQLTSMRWVPDDFRAKVDGSGLWDEFTAGALMAG